MNEIKDAREGLNLLYLFWLYLQIIESHTDPEKVILNKRDVEHGYDLWNKIWHSNLHPKWNKDN